MDSFFKLSFDDESREHLNTICLWAKICAICAFVSYALALIVAVFGRMKSSLFLGETSTAASATRAGNIAGALISAVIGYAINYFLFRFSADAKRGLDGIDQVKLNEGLANLKTYFKFLGVILLIVLILFGLVYMFVMIASLGRG